MKKTLRKELLTKRGFLTQEEIASKSTIILDQLKSNPIYIQSKNVMIFLSFTNEVSTDLLVKDLFQKGKRVFIPLTVPATRELIVSELLDLNKDLHIGNFGVLEPKKEAVRPLPPEALDLVIVPGVGFDTKGWRIGYGGGYYDRFLPKLPPATPTVALAFEVQLVEEIPTASYDFPIQYIITEERFIDCMKNR
ncbi:5-formyltetrahydrofolate cyclo-ligase [Natronincola peptidivorans]|uniref:5-formyltetrahydrofolate cyclo-ligase n=1 Tax=Natronincola peptidivorans TaxID=426128 RepID=A0A1I0BER3_9FIRM|nr:5-formyltetrahydrofolate cyclo-ligase [Natronincola peptidivorans]SET05288.1 5-formyltetrahydrofolate cyclo-ligase [Natronincola peptidivorans]